MNQITQKIKQNFHSKLLKLPNGSYDVMYQEKRYLLSKETHLEGKLIKLYAHELGNNDFISLNYYPKIKDGLLKPCEMPEDKVILFVVGIEIKS
jgi:ribonuclease HIII